MTKQEFESRYGKEVSNEMFYTINEMYMATDLDKDVFVEDYKKHGESFLTYDYFNRLRAKESECMTNRMMINQLLDIIILKGDEHKDAKMFKMAEAQSGKKYVILRKIELGIELSEEDKDYIKENMK